MFHTQRRLVSILAAGSAALAIGASPALAGSSGCAGEDCQDEDHPARVVPVAPTPIRPAPVPFAAPEAPQHARSDASRRTKRVVHGARTRSRRAGKHSIVTVPRGAVAAGAGGMAPHGPDGGLIGLAGAGLVLLAAGGTMVASARRTSS